MHYLLEPDENLFFTGDANWIWSAEGTTGVCPDPRPVQCRYFARTFTFPAGGTLVLALSADTRYLLWLNGKLLTRGPQKGDVAHQFFDTLELTADAQEGENVILARVDSYAKSFPHVAPVGPPASWLSAATVFVADGWVKDADGQIVESLATDARWRVRLDPAIQFIHGEVAHFTGYHERYDCTRLPAGFPAAPGLADPAWQPATVVHTAFRPDNVGDGFLPHRLVPRTIEPLLEVPRAFSRILATDSPAAVELAGGKARLTLPAQAGVRVLLEIEVLCTAYPRLSVSGAAELRLVYAERLNEDGPGARRPTAAGLYGNADEVVTGPGTAHWTPLAWRTCRYLEWTVQAGADPVTAELALDDTFYPLTPAGPFAASDPELERLWTIGVRTQQACAHETFEDCPYYEQLQYAGDTQLQCLYTYLMNGNTALPLQAIRAFHYSRIPEGLTQSRYPSRATQVIPFWSLHYLFMLWDWYEYTGDTESIRDEVFGALEVIRWFLRRQDEHELVGSLRYWCVADWSPQWCAQFNGEVPGVKTGPTALTNFMVIHALDKLALLLAEFEETAIAESFRDDAARLRRAAHAAFWDAQRGVYHDALDLDVASQLTNAWAILVNMPVNHRQLARRIATDPALCQAAYFGLFYVFAAWKAAGEPGLVLAGLEPFRALARRGVTTWPESLDHGRSMCHAWANAGSFQLFSVIWGFAILEPGASHVLVEPTLAGLTSLATTIALPQGPLRLQFSDGAFALAVPDEVRVTFRHGDAPRELGPGTHHFPAGA